MKPTRLLSLFLAALIMLLPLIALAEGESPDIEVTVVIDPDEEAYIPTDDTEVEIISEPFIPENVEKTIIGVDDRRTITNTSAYPYCAIAYLDVEMACGCGGTGTGFMVAPDCLMTAAHMVACAEHLKPVAKITMYFGYVSNKNYYYKYETTNPTFWYNSQFSTGNGLVRAEWDYGYVRVPSSVGTATGNFGMKTWKDSEVTSTRFELAGYKWGVLKSGYGYAQLMNARRMSYTMDDEPGNSGSPVFDADYYVVGICSSGNATTNYGCRITNDIRLEMREHGFFKK